MNTNQGSAVAIVLMILAVVSLIGIGLLTQSRMDVQLTSAIRSQDKLFNLADGAASIAFQDASVFTHDIPVPPSGINPLEMDPDSPLNYYYHWIRLSPNVGTITNTKGKNVVWVQNITTELPQNRQPVGVPLGAQDGFFGTEDFSSAVIMLGYTTDPTQMAGYEIAGGQFSLSYLMLEGTARRNDTFITWATSANDAANLVEHKVHAACLKLTQK